MHVTHIGRYEIVRTLGQGAMGVVYEARDPRLARAVAIKTIRADKLAADQMMAYEARFLTEARSVARLNHPHIVSVYDSGQTDDVTFMVMEYVPGVNLKHCLNHGVRFTPWGAVRLVLDVLAALGHAHQQKILHRDIKPENILLDATGWAKLTDFGIAKILDAEDDNGTLLSGHSIGTPRYMSPEQVRGWTVDARSDLFSAGVLLYELLTARLPFDGSNHFAVAAQILNEAPQPPSVSHPAVSAELDQVVLKALDKHPFDRFQTAAEFADALVAAAASLADGDVQARLPGAHVLVEAESAGMLRWLLSRTLTGADAAQRGEGSMPAASSSALPEGAPMADSGLTVVLDQEATRAPDGPASAQTVDGTLLAQSSVADPTGGSAPPALPARSPLDGRPVGRRTPPWGLVGGVALVVAVATWWWVNRPSATVAPPPTGTETLETGQTLAPSETLVKPGDTAAVPDAAGASGQRVEASPAGSAAGAGPAQGASTAGPGARAVKPAGSGEPRPATPPASGAQPGRLEGGQAEPVRTAPVPAAQPTEQAVKPAPAVPAPPAAPCTGLGFFERESCLWKQCVLEAYRSLPVCERFQSPRPGQ